MKLTRFLPLLALLVLLTSSSSFSQKSHNEAHELAIGGYCPVAYVAMNKAVKPDGKFTATYMGKKWAFMNQDAKKMFEKNPEKYAPRYDGTCATAVAMGKHIGADPKIFATYKGALYLFSNKEAKAKFEDNPDGLLSMADKHWAKLSDH
jgi:YHS domain-containing protein